MGWSLNLIYALLVLIASPWLAWQAWRTGKYREGFAAKLLGHAPRREGDGPCVWLHAVSVGEVNLLSTLIGRMRDDRPDVALFISTTTKSGYDLARKKYPDCTVFYAPLDFTWGVRNAIERVRPSLLVLAELELWPNWIAAAKHRGISVAIVNGRLSEKSFRGYQRIRRWLTRALQKVDLIAVQNDEYAERFLTLGADPAAVHVTGSVKFDGARTDRRNPLTARLAASWGVAPQDVVFLAGSTQEPEESRAVDTFRMLSPAHPELQLVIVPRHSERFAAVAQLLDDSGLAWQRRSCLGDDGADTHARILLVDTIGELGAWWGMAQIGFVGGSLGRRGGQNMIEPAAYGVAVSFGPNTQNFRDVVALLLNDSAAVVVGDGDELTTFVDRCLADPEYRAWLGSRAQGVVARQLGATDRTWRLLSPFISGKEQPSLAWQSADRDTRHAA